MKIKKIMFACLVAALLSVFLIPANALDRNNDNNALEGSWKVRLTPGSMQPQFDEIMTFSAGGGIVESNNYPFFQLGLTAGAGHGTWSQTGWRRFSFTFIKFLFTPDGAAAGTLKVIGTITYSRSNDTWSGPGTVSICDSMANNCNTIDVTNGQATRIIAGQ